MQKFHATNLMQIVSNIGISYTSTRYLSIRIFLTKSMFPKFVLISNPPKR